MPQNVQGHFLRVPHTLFLKSDSLCNGNNGNVPNWGKVDGSGLKASTMKLMGKKGEEVGGHSTTPDTTEHAQRDIATYLWDLGKE